MPAEPGTPRRIACIGECMIELRHTSDGALTIGYGGDTLNTAVYLARIGRGRLAVHYVTALGDDSYSTEMLAGWRDEAIDTSMVAQLLGRLPGLYIIRTDAGGECKSLAPGNEVPVGGSELHAVVFCNQCQ